MNGNFATLSIAMLCGGCCGVAAGTYPGPGWGETPAPPESQNSPSAAVQPVDPALFCPKPSEPSEPSSDDVVFDPPRRDPLLVQKTVRNAFPEYRVCYDAALSRKSDAAGRVQVRFDIDASGAVANACIQPPVLQDGVAVECMLARFKKLQFGSGPPAKVVYPIVFKPWPGSPPASGHPAPVPNR